MAEHAFPQLRSLALSAQGRPLHLRVLLPPNFASIAGRGGKVPVKIEVCTAEPAADSAATGSTPNTVAAANQSLPPEQAAQPAHTLSAPLPPEKLGKGPWSVEPGVFLAALLIESWCNGRIPSMLQPDAAQLRQLLQPLQGLAAVFWLKAPQQPIRWQGGELEGVHEHLQNPQSTTGNGSATARSQANARHSATQRGSVATTSTAQAGNTQPQAGAAQRATPFTSLAEAGAVPTPLPAMEHGLTPLEVDGSSNFLALRLPSKESALYPHALTLVKDNGFQLEPSNGKWWLRDRHKTLQFLADQMQDLRESYRAHFTDSFTERTRNLRFARIEVDVRSTTPRGNEAFDLELYFSAPGLDEGALQQALEKGQHYIEATATHSGKRPAGNSNAQHSAHRGASAGDNAQASFILVPLAVRERAALAQQALGASPAQSLRSRFRSRIRKAEVATAQAILNTLGGTPIPDATTENVAGSRTANQQAAKRQNTIRRTHASSDSDSAENEFTSLAAKLPAQWLELSRALNDLNALLPCPAPQSLMANLRPYQRIGAAWLWHLYRSGLGGILADEMGLGKTVQCLAFLAAAASETDGDYSRSNESLNKPADNRYDRTVTPDTVPSLVVCPAALVENWRREATKFTPHLRVFCHHGDSRLANAQQAAQYDLILTSYGTLTRDQQLFESIAFRIAVADEAQHIKNAKTQNARAMRGLRASGRFLMTGTPVENDIRELQSLFAFILPGYLSPPASSARGSAAVSAAEGRANDRAWLVSRAAPYILRRMKRTVARDLPEKIEQVIYCEFGSAQRAFYRQVQETARRAVQELELGGASESRVRFAAFTELLRLRQTCIDPQLADAQQTDIGSAKREALLELVQEAVEGGHRMLIFSQFTSALRLVAEDLESLGLRHFYLDGQTPNRTALCERFNTDESVAAFLISLRAGGTGLNLTGADTVIHLDPWWNPAAQAQATDRAHRIGQQKIVTVYQLIAAQTVEEQVLTLQREKTALLEQLLDASDAASAKIGLDDLKSLIG